jgi:transcription antitermination factor NusG
MSAGTYPEQFVAQHWLTAQPETPHWYAIATRSRHEKKVAAQLTEKNITTFLPLITETHRWSDRRKVVELPLFPGYAFVYTPASSQQRLRVLQTVGVIGFVGIHGFGIPIPEKQIDDLRTLVATKLPCALYAFLREGQRVRVRGGCLDGVEGFLVGFKPDRSLVISLDPIHRSIAIRVEGYDVTPV